MCLDSVDNKANKKIDIECLEIREDGYIRLWKVFDVNKDGNLVAQFHNYNFYEGKNTARGKKILEFDGHDSCLQYEPGFHCFDNKDLAQNWAKTSNDDKGRERVVYPIKVKKSWITSVGSQGLRKVYVCKHIVV